MTLTASQLSVALGGRPVLHDIDLSLPSARVTAIVGPNGAGKSTLLSCLAGLRTPSAGRAALNGERVDRMPPRARARRIGFLPQAPEIAWTIDVETLVGLGRTPHLGSKGLTHADRAAVASALLATGTEMFARRPVQSLSGGERARVLIARVLAGQPDWILADEPLAGLDPGHQLDAMALLRKLAQDEGRGVVLTLHDLSLALRLADTVVVLRDGRVLAQGAPAAVLSPEVVLAAYGVETHLVQGPGGPMLDIVGRAP